MVDEAVVFDGAWLGVVDDFADAGFGGGLLVDEEFWGLWLDGVVWGADEAFDVVLGAPAWVEAAFVLDVVDVFGGEDEDFAACGFAEVVDEFVDDDVVAAAHPAACEGLAFADGAVGAGELVLFAAVGGVVVAGADL